MCSEYILTAGFLVSFLVSEVLWPMSFEPNFKTLLGNHSGGGRFSAKDVFLFGFFSEIVV